MAHVEHSNKPPILRDDWYIEDIQQDHPWVTEEQAIEIMEEIADSFDANTGINWEVIAYTVDGMYPKPDDYIDPDEENEE